MCQRVTCSSCGKPTFVGCGRHVEQVLGDVAPADRCSCGQKKSQAGQAGQGGEPSFWKRLLG
ncbi:MAG: hypothetical protein ACRELB_17820 [Polyangiaceae bacterium]